MKIRKYTHFEHSGVKQTPMFLHQCVACQESPTNNLLNDEVIEQDGTKSVHVGTDVGLILREKKFQKLNQFTLDTMVSNLKRDVPDLSRFSDDEILSTVQSRYTQSAADVRTYERYLRNRIDSVVKDAELEQKRAAFKAKYAKKSDNDKNE